MKSEKELRTEVDTQFGKLLTSGYAFTIKDVEKSYKEHGIAVGNTNWFLQDMRAGRFTKLTGEITLIIKSKIKKEVVIFCSSAIPVEDEQAAYLQEICQEAVS